MTNATAKRANRIAQGWEAWRRPTRREPELTRRDRRCLEARSASSAAKLRLKIVLPEIRADGQRVSILRREDQMGEEVRQ